MSLRLHSDGIGAHCFGCGRGGTVLDLVAAKYELAMTGADFGKVVEIGEGLAGIRPGEAPPPRPAARPTPPRIAPPRSKVRDLWNAAQPVALDADAVEWLEDRALEADRVEDRDLARVLPRDIRRLPRWAWGPAGAWTETGHRLIVPTFDENGDMVSLHARRITGADPRKTLWPAGHAAVGVFADALGRQLLRDGRAPSWWSSPTIIVAEGVPDFLTFATAYLDDESSPAVLGLVSGTWTQEIADRIPDGVRVVLAMHGDDAGEKYKNEITRTLGVRMEVVEVSHETA